VERRITWRGIYLPAGSVAPDPAWFEGPAYPRFRGTARPREAELDAESACYLTRIAGVGPVIYLDLEDGDAMTIEYLAAWVDVIAIFQFRAGMCCSHEMLTNLVERGAIDPTEWLFRAASESITAEAREERDVWWVH
jgi:hypothetical protein